MILLDSHVHFHKSYDLQAFFDGAYQNFKFNAERLSYFGNDNFVLMLADYGGINFFSYLLGESRKKTDERDVGKNWRIKCTDDEESVWLHDGASRQMLVIPGQQIVTSERLEVLSLFSNQVYKNAESVKRTINEIQKNNHVPVLPWSPGKWFGARGKIVSDIIKHLHGNIFLGDIRGRPKLWLRPLQFKQADLKGIRILHGSDPLDFSDEMTVAGGYGFAIEGSLEFERPTFQLKCLLCDGKTTFRSFGDRIGLIKFVRNQIRLRTNKRNQVNRYCKNS